MMAMVAALLSHAASNKIIIDDIKSIHRLLKYSGGVRSVDKVCEFLCMTRKEVIERIIDRSIFAIVINRDWYVPVFQFVNRLHIESFHDVWDVLHKNLSPLEICSFFVEDVLAGSDLLIFEILRDDPDPEEVARIIKMAQQRSNIASSRVITDWERVNIKS